MTLTIFRIMLLRLWNNPLELVLIFVVPVGFFSLFAMIFSHGIATSENKRVRVGIIDPGQSELASQLVEVFEKNKAIDCQRPTKRSEETSTEDFVLEIQATKQFDLLVRVDPPEEEPAEEPAQSVSRQSGRSPQVILITDGQNPMALAIVQAIVQGFFLQRAAEARLAGLPATEFRQRPDEKQARERPSNPSEQVPRHKRMSLKTLSKIRDVDEVFTEEATDFTDETNSQTINWPQRADPADPADHDENRAERSEAHEVSASEELDFVVQNPQSGNQQHPQVAMYAAGIAVLFLLFSTTGNAATLLEEQETGTLDRILGSQAGLIDVIFGKWLWLFVLGVVQITVMFTWADLVFGIHLRDHLSGFLVMTASTSAATASFGMFLATVSGSRAQLSALSVLLILSMSALGGSMIPRFVMSTRMKEIGQWTFNAWAIDGYQKVFWYQLPIKSLQNEVFVLCGSAIILGLLSLILSRRWRPA
jgi:ABC-2 type transport system permease protein